MSSLTPQAAMEKVGKYLSPWGMDPLPPMTHEEHGHLAYGLGQMESALSFWRGDHILQIKKHLGQVDYGHAQELAKLYGISPKRLLNDMTTARTWPHETRQEWLGIGGISTSHMETLNAIAAHNMEEAEYWLEMCASSGWSVSRLRQELHGSPHAKNTPPLTLMDLFSTKLPDASIKATEREILIPCEEGHIHVEYTSYRWIPVDGNERG